MMRTVSVCGSLIVLLLGGCPAPQSIQSRQPAHVLILPGIGGDDIFISYLPRMIEREVPNTSAQAWDWTRIEPYPSFMDIAELTDYPRNLRRARRLATQLIAWRHEHPDGRLYLVGFSGGTG